MKLVLVGADFEENLGMGLLAACVHAAGHAVRVVPFNDPDAVDDVVTLALRQKPDVVGLSMQFQHRAHEFLGLARRLRAAGFRGHLTCGGHFPTLAHDQVLGHAHGVDSVVLHEGEHTLVNLLDALRDRRPLDTVAGLALAAPGGAARLTAPRAIVEDLDALPHAARYRPHNRHLDVPFIPIMGSRGCWGRCSYCSITSFYRDAREKGGGKTLRLRSPANIADEMARLWHAAGEPCIYCFHDDNFLLPRPADTLERVRAIRAALDARQVGMVGIIGKARPDCVTADLARELRALGVLRLYVGVENASQAGATHMRRSSQTARVREALRACREAGIFACYNILLFEPDATLDDVRENIAFMREHADHPVNFCRAEPYHGTPLQRELARRQELGGSYLGWNYRIVDDKAELLFRICAAAFRERNFAPDGVANRYMGLGYSAAVLAHFHAGTPGVARVSERARELTRGIARETAGFLEEALALAAAAGDDRELVERETALLGLRIAGADGRWQAQMDALEQDMEAVALEARKSRKPRRQLVGVAQGLALGASLALAGTVEGISAGCVYDPVPGDGGMVVDPVPQDGGVDAGYDAGNVVDPLPEDAGRDSGMVVDPPPPDAGRDAGMVVDPPPPDAGRDAGMVVDPLPEDAGFDAGMMADPPPPDAGRDAGMVVDPLPPDAGFDGGHGSLIQVPGRQRIDQWRDSAPRRGVRTRDLPLYEPPTVRLSFAAGKDGVQVQLCGGPDAVSTRWQAEGTVEGDGRQVRWSPAHDDDHLGVAVRSAGGVAVVTLRARDVKDA
ncbi:MAG: cobalamin B12-binding domain-containing protein [Deltaproteobacteria bacterium]|nr:cobalamin B12-binding domain-containing protein [Deltaproteobacteria bacterium]